MNPVPSPSQGGDGVFNFLHRLMGTSGPSPLFAVGAAGVRQADGFGSSGVCVGSSLSVSGRLPSLLSSSSGSVLPLAPPVAHFAASVV